MIYFIREGFEGNIKIGYTTENLYKRKSALQNGNSKRLVIIGTMQGNEGFESYLKNKFQHCKLVGEWFTPKKELLDFIDDNVQFHQDYVFFLRDMVMKTRDKVKVLNQDKPEQRGLNNVGKWNIVESGGYYRAFRSIDGKNVGVYIGREFTEEKAREKITAKGFPID